MAYCYRCGRRITRDDERLRRNVPTGNWIRTRALQRGGKVAQAHYGMRVVCGRCAHLIDIAAMKKDVSWFLRLGLALAVLFLVILFRLWE